MVHARGSTLMDLTGVGPVVAARILADVGDVARFADRNRFASWTGTAPLDASSGEQIRHRLSRAGNRKMNHGCTSPRPAKPAWTPRSGATTGETSPGQDPAASHALPETTDLRRRLPTTPRRRQARRHHAVENPKVRTREGTAGRHSYPARPTLTRSSTLRISHFPDPQPRRYAAHHQVGRANTT